MINFEKKTWYNKNDADNEAKRVPISASQLNRIEDAISAMVSHENDMTKHWWRRSKKADGGVIKFADSKTSKVFWLWDTKSQTTDIYYSATASIKMDNSTGKQYFELDNPTTWTINFDSLGTSNWSELTNKFFIFKDEGETFAKTTLDGGIMYYGAGVVNRRTGNMAAHDYGFGVEGMFETSIDITYDFLDYVSSPEKDTYAEGWNETELLMYEYLGVPFINSRESLDVDIGYYCGNLMSNRLIKTRKKPICVWWQPGISNTIVTELFSHGNYSTHIQLSNDGFIISGNTNVNNAGSKYDYIVFLDK